MQNSHDTVVGLPFLFACNVNCRLLSRDTVKYLFQSILYKCFFYNCELDAFYRLLVIFCLGTDSIF